MAKGVHKITGDIIKEYLTKFPDSPSLTLAKKIYKENTTSFSSVEHARSLLRSYRGQAGVKNRGEIKDKRFFKEAGSKNPFDNFPESYALTYEPFVISQTRVLILSDLHIPYHSNEAIQVALRYGLEKEVNCILINGDLLDMPNQSKHEPDWRMRRTKDEFDAVRLFLATLRELFPKARIIFKHGNHDERWEKWLYIKAPEIFDDSYFHLEERLGLNELRVETVKDKLPVKIGKLTVLHGHELNGGGGVNPARGTFLKTIDNVLIGHFHRSSQHTEPTLGGDVIVTTSQGCLCGMYPMFARVNKWNHGFAYVEHEIKTGEYVLQNLKIVKGKVY
jgi:predicted phosphodiesterase